MKKISNLLMMALLTVGMGLTSCDEQLDNAVSPGVMPVVDEVSSIEIDLSKIDEKYLDTEKTKLQMMVGNEVTLSFTILPEEAADTEVELTADDETILSIDGLKVKALKAGETKVTAKAGDKTAECTVTVTLAYPIALSAVTADYLGSVIGADGKVYKDKAAAEGASPATTVVAMIAQVTSTGHGLAIQLNSSLEGKTWADAKTYAEGLPAVSGGTWRLPWKEDWQKMFVGCAVSGDASASDHMNPIAGFKAKIAATGITWKSGGYWSKSESTGSKAWLVGVDLDGSNAKADFDELLTSVMARVLACLDF